MIVVAEACDDVATHRSIVSLRAGAWCDHHRIRGVSAATLAEQGDDVVSALARFIRCDMAREGGMCTHQWLAVAGAVSVYTCEMCGERVEGDLTHSLEDWWLSRLDAAETDAKRRMRARGAEFYERHADRWTALGLAFSRRCGLGAAAHNPMTVWFHYALASRALFDMERILDT